MNASFLKIFTITFILSLVVLTLIERLINGSNKMEHILGWACVAIAIAGLAGIMLNKNTNSH